MLRQSTLDQLKRINGEIKKQGGITDRKSDSEKGLPNGLWIHDPVDADKSGKRKVATYDQMFSVDIPDADTTVKMKNEKVYYYDKNGVWFSSSDGFDLDGHKKRFGNDITFSVDGVEGQFNNIEDYKKAVKMNKTVFTSKSLDELEKERDDAKKRVMMKRKNITTNENTVKINGFDYFYDNIKNKLYSDKSKTNEIDVYKQLTKNEREQLQNCIKYNKNENMKLNEGKIKQALQDAIDEYYLEDSADAVNTISELTGLNFDQVITILDTSSQDNAMENIINQKDIFLSTYLDYYTKNETKNMKTIIMSFEKMFENGPNDTPQEIMKNMKTIANWHSEDTPKKEMNQLLIGKYIDNGKVKGYIQRIEGDIVFIDSIIEPLGLMKIKLKDAVKGYKTEKEKSESNMAIEGPNNKSLGGAPKIGGGFSPKLDGKGQVVADQKISNKINKEKTIKKFTDINESWQEKAFLRKEKYSVLLDEILSTIKEKFSTWENNKEYHYTPETYDLLHGLITQLGRFDEEIYDIFMEKLEEINNQQ